MRKQYIEAGKIVTTHGVRGEVKLYPWCDDPEMFLDIETIYLDAKGQKPLALEGVRHKSPLSRSSQRLSPAFL